MDKLEKIIDVLKELRESSLAIDSESDLKSTMQKYSMLFLGGSFNKITSMELRHCLLTIFEYEISEEEFLKLIPVACKSLRMEVEPLSRLEEPGQLVGYYIQLFK
ncbi:hypothetical protein AT278_25525 [Bacillus cereus]|uniref:hypothetical protein n=1 Tax=Bacillus TaxID=1386 RepID=UPI00077AB495|nr:hypothetical protein [Bacillus cereus]KXY66892.1 hypothetical protein AT278_25525 [Bacillus cereus]